MILKKEFYEIEFTEENLKKAKKTFTIENKEYLKKKRLGFPIYNLKPTISLYKVLKNKILIPSGIDKEKIKEIFGESFISDNTSLGKKQIINLHTIKKDIYKLYDYQEKALKEILEKINKEKLSNFGINGIIHLPPGAGKTYLSMHLINKLNLKTLWLANKKILLEQAKTAYQKTFNCVETDIGQIESGIETIGKKITFATLQSISKKDKDFILKNKEEFGLVIVDEAHNVVGTENQINTFTNALNSFNARYKIGLTATPDFENERVLRMFLGEDLTKIEKKEIKTLPIEISIIENEKEYNLYDYTNTDGTSNYLKLATMLGLDSERVALVCKTVKQLFELDRKILICCKYVKEIEKYAYFLSEMGLVEKQDFIKITGKTTKKEREKLLSIDYKILIATNSLLGEGFDEPKLDTLIITNCMRKEKNIIQLLGRVRRNYKNKTTAYCYIINDTKVRPRKEDFKAINKFVKKENKNIT